MKFVPSALAVAATILVVPVLTGYASAVDASPEVGSTFSATTITTLAANGIELVGADRTTRAVESDLNAADASEVARRSFGGDVEAAVLGPFTDHGTLDTANGGALSRDLAWQVVLDDVILPSGERGRAWVAIDAGTAEVLGSKPLLENTGS